MSTNIDALSDLEAITNRLDQELIEGEILTNPSLLMGGGGSDGTTWVADVQIEGYDEILHSVPLAMGNRDLIYAEPGSAVMLRRNSAGGGRPEVVGFSKRKPGTRHLVAVDVGAMTWGPLEDITLESRRFTYEELNDPDICGGYGTIPYGAYGVWKGGKLIEVRIGQ